MWMHMVIVPRTIPGLVIKLAICTSMVLGGVGLMGRTVQVGGAGAGGVHACELTGMAHAGVDPQGVFASAHDVAANPPRVGGVCRRRLGCCGC